MTDPDSPAPWPAREDLPPPPLSEAAEHQRALANGLGIAGLVLALIALAAFFVPFLDLLCAIGGALFSSRALYLVKGQTGRLPTGIALALAGLILGILALVPGALITYDAAFRH